jgi:plastocyanin
MLCTQRWLFVYLPLAAVVAMGAGCGRQNASPNESPALQASALTTEPDSNANSLTTATQGGTLQGTVSFPSDPIPTQTMIPIQTDPEYCDRYGKEGLYPAEDCLIDPDSRGVRNVIVYLESDALRDRSNTVRQDIVVDNRNCRFEPHVNVSTVGSTVEVKNSDLVYHTTHLYGPPGFAEFNPGMRTQGESERTVLTRPGLYQVKCDRHGWMSAFLRVESHPFHAVTNEKGHFEITGIPAGTYQVGMFHERFRPQPRDPKAVDVTIDVGQTTSVDLTLTP